MNILLTLICLSILIYFFDRQIKKYSILLYFSSMLLSLIGIFIPKDIGISALNYFFNDLLKKGVIAGALFILVMYAIIFPFSKAFRSKLMKLRAELAITASLFTIVHNIVYGRKYFILLFTNIGKLKSYEVFAAILSLLMISLLIPLTITSFMSIRKKMEAKKWKKLQRFSYIFYALLYFHIVLLFSGRILQAKTKYIIDFIIYTLIFALYLILRLNNYIKQNKTISNKKTLSSFVTILISILALLLSFASLIPLIYTHNSINNEKTESITPTTNNSMDGSNTKNTLKDGTYEGKAPAYNGNLYLEVKILDSKISEINITKHAEDDGYFEDARDGIIPKILEQQNTEVDTISDATTTSEAIIKAVNNALSLSRE